MADQIINSHRFATPIKLSNDVTKTGVITVEVEVLGAPVILEIGVLESPKGVFPGLPGGKKKNNFRWGSYQTSQIARDQLGKALKAAMDAVKTPEAAAPEKKTAPGKPAAK